MKPIIIMPAALILSACATARLHSQTELNSVGRECGVALGELVQDEAEKKLLFLIRNEPTIEQRSCIARWAKRNGLKPVFVNMDFQS